MKIGEDEKEQQGKLDDFEAKYLAEGASTPISDLDELFLKKEVVRYRSALLGVKGLRSRLLLESNNIGKPPVSSEDLYALRQNLKALEKEDTIDMPRIIKAIAGLEGFGLKALRGTLNEDNRGS